MVFTLRVLPDGVQRIEAVSAQTKDLARARLWV